ncbi:amidoligase family protein [Pendulispora brunnea]|uniref:Amidoligase family protein n=1 Tax=Pendulispora brunnea TaxID=2905690 RepID=A0ABZ2K7E2_9BACT
MSGPKSALPGGVTNAIKTLRFGIEIEVANLSPRRLAMTIAAAVGGRIIGGDAEDGFSVLDRYDRVWTAILDLSIVGTESGEVVSPILRYEDLAEVAVVVRAVAQAGGRTNRSTGIHVHVDSSRFDAASMTELVRLVYRHDRLIEYALRIDPFRRESYCKPVDATFVERLEARGATMADVKDAWYGRAFVWRDRADPTRYHGLNLNSVFYRGTVELRHFNSTLDPNLVVAYVQFALALSARALSPGTEPTPRAPQELRFMTAKFDFRVFLLRLGLKGDEFAAARQALLAPLGGKSTGAR